MKTLDLIRSLDRPDLSPDFQEKVFQRIRSGRVPLSCRRRAPSWMRWALAAAGLALAALGWRTIRPATPPAVPGEIFALAGDHARRATLALREIAKSANHPGEASRQDHV